MSWEEFDYESLEEEAFYLQDEWKRDVYEQWLESATPQEIEKYEQEKENKEL